jgi:hypothetical protein
MVYPAINPKGKSVFHWNSWVSKFQCIPARNAGKRYDLNVIFCKSKKIKEATMNHSDSYSDDSKSVPDFELPMLYSGS